MQQAAAKDGLLERLTQEGSGTCNYIYTYKHIHVCFRSLTHEAQQWHHDYAELEQKGNDNLQDGLFAPARPG